MGVIVGVATFKFPYNNYYGYLFFGGGPEI
jgi:hypothetical protein